MEDGNSAKSDPGCGGPDSVRVITNSTNYDREIKQTVNKPYPLLELDIDGGYRYIMYSCIKDFYTKDSYTKDDCSLAEETTTVHTRPPDVPLYEHAYKF
jgi:hypothetical protein